MALTNVLALEGMQVKKQTARGTPETVMTRWCYPMAGSPPSWSFELEISEHAEMNRSYHMHSAFSLGRYRNRITYTERMSYEDAVWWYEMITDSGNLTGVTTGSTPAGYTYQPDPDGTQDVLGTFSMKLGCQGNIYRFDRCAVNTATFKFDATTGNDPDWVMTAEIWATKITAGVTFEALSERTREIINSLGTVLYLDTATIGTTQKTLFLRSGEFTINNNLEEKFFAEDLETAGADFARGEQLFTGSVVGEFKDDTEFALMRAGTARKIRVLKTGAQIGTTPTTNYKFQMDWQRAFYTTASPGYAGQNKIITMGWTGYKSPTVTIPFEPEIVNASATITA